VQLIFRSALLFALSTAGCAEAPSGPDFSGVVSDFAQTDATTDLAIASVYCQQTCQAPAACCLTQNAGGGWEAMCANSCPDGGVFTQCTGPSDCNPQLPNCCITVNLAGDMDASIMSSGGGAMCTADCPGGLGGGNTLFHTKLCRQTADCMGYTGDFGFGSEPFDGCCQSPRAPAVHFCAPTRLAGNDGLTCN
jgi:hypothetical protein